MNEIFRDSLERYSNVCNGCYKTIYTLAVDPGPRARHPGDRHRAVARPVLRDPARPAPVRGRALRSGRHRPARCSRPARSTTAPRRRHRPARHLAVRRRRASSTRSSSSTSTATSTSISPSSTASSRSTRPGSGPTDTGRSTNCLVNVAGIYVHRLERGFHNYALPYSWDVRLGHKTRAEALEELDDDLDEAEVSRAPRRDRLRPRTREVSPPGTRPITSNSIPLVLRAAPPRAAARARDPSRVRAPRRDPARGERQDRTRGAAGPDPVPSIDRIRSRRPRRSMPGSATLGGAARDRDGGGRRRLLRRGRQLTRRPRGGRCGRRPIRDESLRCGGVPPPHRS